MKNMKQLRQFLKAHEDEEERREKILSSHVLDGKQVDWKSLKELVKTAKDPDEKHVIDGIDVTVQELDEYFKYEKYDSRMMLYTILGLAAVVGILIVGGPFFVSNPGIQLMVALLSFGTFIVLFIFLIFKQSLKWHKQAIGAKEVFYRFDRRPEQL
jgi:hypothetical protein